MQLLVPPLGESITEATITRWLKRAGDAVNAGETLVELETDKITVEVPALKGGLLTAIAKAEGDVVKVGEVLGDFDDSASAVSAAGPAAAAAPTPAPVPAAAAAPSASSPPPSVNAGVRAAPSAV
ncbi:MAG TPA: biotin/lipoyl-containing protein, partial [Gemmatimonadaceae bacterium]